MSERASEGREGRIVSRFGAESTALDVIDGIDLTGKNAIVTGGASGLGVESVRALAHAGAAVLIAARNVAAAAATAAAINKSVGAERVSHDLLELDSLASVRAFASRWGDKPLSILVCNAGVMACPFSRTRDGFEMQFGTNHLGHFLLTRLLTPALAKSAPARVVSLSSSAHMYGGVDFDDPNFDRRDYHPFKAYGQSKTANALFAVEYDRRHHEQGIRAFAVMPGVIDTNLGRYLTQEMIEGLALKATGEGTSPIVRRKSTEQGAATSVWAATAPELEGLGGLYLEDCYEAPPFSRELPRGSGVMPFALDPNGAQRLWELSNALVGLSN